MADVVHLPRPSQARSPIKPLAFFIRVGRNDHREMLDLLAGGEQGVFGFVIDAQNVDRHRELMVEAKKRGFDLILDPKTQQSALPGSHTEKLASLPCGCRDTHCCPHGLRDMIKRPARHAIYQRSREIESLSQTPESVRVSHYLEGRVRRVSDDVAAIAALKGLDKKLHEGFSKKQAQLSRFRQAMAHFAESSEVRSKASPPLRRRDRESHGG
ncbi:hypothetical protein BH10PSE11_BH10PSE11_21350 [soil metagenome]